MIIAIPSTGKDKSSSLDLRFGRAKYLVVYTISSGEYCAYDNFVNLNAAQGAGIQTAQNIVEVNADVTITGNCGPNAFKVLSAGDVKVYLCEMMSVEDAVKKFQNGELTLLTDANVEGHWI